MLKIAIVGAGALAVIGISAGVAITRASIDGPPAMKAPSPAKVAADRNVQRVADADNRFGFRLLAKLHEATPKANVFFSPVSVSGALSLLLNGAGGKTQHDISTTLCLNETPISKVNAANAQLIPSLESADPKVQIAIANALWAPTPFAAAFEKTCRESYGASANRLNLASPNAAATINGWVSKNTRGNIPTIVTAGDIAAATAVLTNAVYFHGTWTDPFEKSATHDAPFTLADGHSKTVPMMVRSGQFAYLETPALQAISLPYGSGRTSLIVLLPKSSLNSFLPELNSGSWKVWVGKLQARQVTVLLPRFKLEYRATLNNPLCALGMTSAFGPGADFAPMGMPGSFVSAVLHKATMDVDEQGTTATAATAIVMAQSAMPVARVVMNVDHPFFCAIVDNLTGTILFMGAIQIPA